jgi:Protein of unknown function (DUF1236)
LNAEELMRRPSTLVILAALLWCTATTAGAQTPAPSEPVVPSSPKLNLTLEQRHVIKEIIKDIKSEAAPAQVRAEVGEPIPEGVGLRPMPTDIALKVPQVKAHRFFLTGEEIVIVDPKDNRVAEVIKLAAD